MDDDDDDDDDADEVVDGDEVDKDNQDDWMQYANITSQFHVYVVEVLMVIDYAIYRRSQQLDRFISLNFIFDLLLCILLILYTVIHKNVAVHL